MGKEQWLELGMWAVVMWVAFGRFLWPYGFPPRRRAVEPRHRTVFVAGDAGKVEVRHEVWGWFGWSLVERIPMAKDDVERRLWAEEQSWDSKAVMWNLWADREVGE